MYQNVYEEGNEKDILKDKKKKKLKGRKKRKITNDKGVKDMKRTTKCIKG